MVMNMTYFFNLDLIPFEKVKSNEKTIELRLNDEKRQKLQIGDKIVFVNREDENDIIPVKVTALYKFPSFKELYSSLPLDKCGYTADNMDSASPDDMLKYYTKKEEKKFGVLGVEFEVMEKNESYSAGLVLEGGGTRLIYSSGVLDAFIENGIEFPYVIGVSGGSCNGASFLGKNIHRMRDITLKYSNDKRYMSVGSMLRNGEYLNSKWIFGELTYDISPLDYDTFENSNSVFCIVATNAKTGKAEYFYPTDFRKDCKEIQASCALPVAAKPVTIGKDIYYDGGLLDSIPLEHAFADGCKKCVVILTQDKDYVKKPMGHSKVVNRVLKKYPLTAKAILNRHNMYNRQREYAFEQERLGNALVICPERPLNCSTLEKSTQKLQEIYDLGYNQGLKCIDQVKEFIK